MIYAFYSSCNSIVFSSFTNNFASELKPVACQHNNIPNPFQSYTEISYTLYEAGFVTLNIFDLNGRKIESLVNKFQSSNTYSVTINGGKLKSGVYFSKLKVEESYYDIKKMVLIKVGIITIPRLTIPPELVFIVPGMFQVLSE